MAEPIPPTTRAAAGVLSDLGAALHSLASTNPELLAEWLRTRARIWHSVFWVALGAGAYGATLGLQRSALQSAYVCIKLPLLLVLTALVTALANGMLAQLLGARISMLQSLKAVAVTYALLAVLLGSFAPLSLFMLYNLPQSVDSMAAYHTFVVLHVTLIAFAGILAHRRLLHMIRGFTDSTRQAMVIFIVWLAINLFVGAQLSWNLRPFFGTPGLDVTFLRADAFAGSFYESVARMIAHKIFG